VAGEWHLANSPKQIKILTLTANMALIDLKTEIYQKGYFSLYESISE
jgi:hypothetical protein